MFSISFIMTLWFSAMQSTFPLVMWDRFGLDAEHVWYLFWFIWITAIIYQAKVIQYVKKVLESWQMIIFGLVFLIVWFLLFAVNNTYGLIFFIIFMFPVGYWTVNPTIASMQSKLWKNHVWKILWMNASMISLWNIVWPFLAGSLYIIWNWLPYIISTIFFVIALVLIILNRRRY